MTKTSNKRGRQSEEKNTGKKGRKGRREKLVPIWNQNWSFPGGKKRKRGKQDWGGLRQMVGGLELQSNQVCGNL